MDTSRLRKERERLQALLDKYTSGSVTHYDEDERGELKRDTTQERVESLRSRIAEIDCKLSDDNG